MADDFSKKILLSVEIENSQLIKVAAQSTAALDKLKAEKKELDKQLKSGVLKEGTDEFNNLNEAIQKNLAEQRILKKEVSESQKAIDNLTKSNLAAEGSYNQISAELGNLKAEYKALSAEERDNIEVGGKLLDQINQHTDDLKALDAEQGVFVRNVGNYGNTLEGLQQQIKDLSAAATKMDLNSEEYKATTEQVAKLKGEVELAQGKVNEFGEKEPKNPTKKAYEDAFEAAGALTSSIGLLTIAFGKSETVQQVQAKALQVVAIAQTVTNIAKAKGAIIDTFAVVKTKALTAAQFLYSQVVGKSTGAMKLFRIALAGTGVGLLVIALGELIFNFDAVSKQVNKVTNRFNDFVVKLSGGSKVLEGVLTALAIPIIGLIGPIILLIKLISDFGGTIEKFQNFVNGIIGEITNFTDRLGFLGKGVRAVQGAFNFLANSVKSLDKEHKKFKPSVEGLTTVYADFNEQLDKNKKKRQDEIALAKAQGKSEQVLADLTRKNLQATIKERQASFDKANEIANKLIAQNSKLTQEEQKLFDKVTGDYEQAQLDLAIFDAEQQQARNEKYKEYTQERLQLEKDLQNQLNELRISQIKDEFEREQAALEEKRRQDSVNNEIALKDAIKRFGSTSQIAEQYRQLEIEQQKVYAKDSLEIEKNRLKAQEDALKQSADNVQRLQESSLMGRAGALTEAYNLEIELVNKSNKNAKIKNEEKLKLTLKFYQDQLALAQEFAKKDGVLQQEEIDKINDLQVRIEQFADRIANLPKEGNTSIAEMIGLTPEAISQMEFYAGQVQSILSTINDVVNANAQNRMRALDDAFKLEQANIENSTLSQAQKEQKIQELTEKFAKEKYAVELEQFRANKAIQITQAAIGGALAVVQSLANTTIPFPYSLIAPITIGATTAAQIGIIAGQPEPPPPQFAGGGYNMVSDDPQGYTKGATLYRKSASGRAFIAGEKGKEWIAPNWMTEHPVYGNYINEMDNIRVRGFAAGGFTGQSISNTINQNIDVSGIASALANELRANPPVVTVGQINRVQNQVAVNQVRRSV